MNLQSQLPFVILFDESNNEGCYQISLIPFGLKKPEAGDRNLGLETFSPGKIVPIEYNYFQLICL
jgi:hypothetical protein